MHVLNTYFVDYTVITIEQLIENLKNFNEYSLVLYQWE